MVSYFRSILILSGFILIAGCNTSLTTQKMIDESIEAMGGAEKLKPINVVVLQGSGTHQWLGEEFKPGEPGPNNVLKRLFEVYDYSNGRASFEYDMQSSANLGNFNSKRREALLTHDESGGQGLVEYVRHARLVMSPGGSYGYGHYPSPGVAMRRSYLAVVLDLLDESGAADGQMAEDRAFGGRTLKFGTATTKLGEPLDLYFDPDTKLLVAYEVTETHPVLGDIHGTYEFEDFKPVDGVLIPHRVKFSQEGNSGEVQYSSVTFGEDAEAKEALTLPEEFAAEVPKAVKGDYVPLVLTEVAPGVLMVRGSTHTSMVVEFPSWLVAVETPQSEIQTKRLVQMLKERFPDKPVRYAAITHPHHDHIAGLRAFAALGATVLAEKNHEPNVKKILDARHSYPPDELERNRQKQQNVGGLEVYEGTKILSDGGRTLEFLAIKTEHYVTNVVAYVPSARIMFQSDWSATIRKGDFKTLFDASTALNPPPQRMISGHGGISSFEEVVKVARAGS